MLHLYSRGLLSTCRRSTKTLSPCIIPTRLYTQYPKNDQLYIHPHGQHQYKISLSPIDSSVPVGFSETYRDINPTNFQVNPSFVLILHEQIKKKVHNDFSFIIEAGVNVNSFMPIYDFREIPRFGRIPEIDNIFGYVHVDKDGKMIPGTYEENNMYRICNGIGLPRLSDYLYQQIRAQCEKEAHQE